MTRSKRIILRPIFHLGIKGTEKLATNCQRANGEQPSRYDMIKKIGSRKRICNYKRYQGVSFNPIRTKRALSIIESIDLGVF